MNEELDNAMRVELVDALVRDAPVDNLVGILRAYRDRGATQQEEAEVLEALRAKASTEAEEDRILELMDFVHGFCSPHMRLYGSADPAPT